MSTIPNIRRETTREGVYVITFERSGSAANIFDRGTLLELAMHVDAVAADPEAKGLVFISNKPAIFIAGADLNALSTLGDEQLQRFIALGQETFNKIAALKIPTVAAIHGACVGGGYEMSLACDYRVASSERATKIGLPETKLGILPAWGGSTRLPRLVGLRRGLDIILGGKTPAASQALRYGMIDQIAPRESLMEAATALIARGKRPKLAQRLMDRAVRLGAPILRAQLLKKTRGHYPALEEAFNVAVHGSATSEGESLRLEQHAVAKLAQSDTCKNLMRLFLQQERAKKRTITGAKRKNTPKAESAAVVGAGVMGSAIAQWLSARGLKVILKDIDPPRVATGMANITRLYASGVKRNAMSKVEARDGLDRVLPTASDVPMEHLDVLIEAIVEKVEVKKRLFAGIAPNVGPNTLIATNTSALSITEMAEALPDPSRLVGIHFFNPVHRMQLVEVVCGDMTSSETADRALAVVQQIGKLPIIVRDRPGFVVNRILLPYLVEAGQLFERGASRREIDDAMLEFGMPMGPLRLIDEVGVDIAADVATNLAGHFPERLTVPAILGGMIDAKMLGRKSGRGFYIHGKTTKPNYAVVRFRQSSEARRYSWDDLQKRMVLLMVAESARCLEEKVAESAADIDFAMVMGTGFAPFLGGPLRYADSVGLPRIVERMRRYQISIPSLIQQLADQGRRFHED